jgi:cell shape-determining protein MreD
VGAPAMNRFTAGFLVLAIWLSAFAQTQFSTLRDLLSVPLALGPALVCCVALGQGLGATVTVAVLSGLLSDSLSASPLGAAVPALFLLGFTLHLQRHLILRDQRFAQFWIGLGAGVAVPLLTLATLGLTRSQPAAGAFTPVQLLTLGLLNGIACPALFRVLDLLHRTFDYRPLTSSSFRPDRETVRGRQFRPR